MKKERFISLKTKIIIGVIVMCFLIGALAIYSVNRIASVIIDREYKQKAEEIPQTVAKAIDPKDVLELRDHIYNIYTGIDNVVPSTEWGSDEWNEYMAHYEGTSDLPVFKKLQDTFREYQDIYQVDCIYIVYYRTHVMQALYLVDGAYGEDECLPGVCDSFEDGIWPDENDPMIPATITNEGIYGWLVTAGYPIMLDGEVVAHLCVDISMNDINAKKRYYVISTALVMLGITIIMLAVCLLFVTKSIINPIHLLSDTARNYCSENNDVEHHEFEKLSIGSHDEIGQLLSSMKQMESDMNTNINTLIDTKVNLREAEELAVKDPLTGIRNKLAYDREVEKLEKDLADGFNEFGLAMVDLNFLKKTNDTYGHEKGDISIRRLCMLVCEIFDHSPVFRIGGDEFIVVLKNHDYRYIDQLIDDFYARLDLVAQDDTLNPWEKISAAIGYYKFDKKVDSTVEDVFMKADKAMYDRKVAMKAERKD